MATNCKQICKNREYQLKARKMMAAAGRSQAVVVPSLYIALTGDMAAAAVLNQVLYWMDRSTNGDGWFYKSYADWKTETGLSEYQMRRVVGILRQFGLQTKVKMANGAPTVHYRIDFEIFEAALREVLGEEITESNHEEVEDRSLRNFGNEPEQTSETITENTKEEKRTEKEVHSFQDELISFASEGREELKRADDWRWEHVRALCKVPREIRLKGIEGDIWRVEGVHDAYTGLRTLQAQIRQQFGGVLDYQVRGVGVPAWA